MGTRRQVSRLVTFGSVPRRTEVSLLLKEVGHVSGQGQWSDETLKLGQRTASHRMYFHYGVSFMMLR